MLGIYASLVIEAAGKGETTFRLPSFESIKNINPNTYEYTWRQIETVLIMINAMREQQILHIQLFEENDTSLVERKIAQYYAIKSCDSVLG